MLDLLRPNIPSQQFQRKRKIDRERDNKICFFTKKLIANKITPAEFLEAMAVKDICPKDGILYSSSGTNNFYRTPFYPPKN